MKRVLRDKNQSIIDYFLKQVDVDLNEYRDDTTRQFDKRNMLTVDWKSMSPSIQRLVQQAANAYGGTYLIQDAGSWMKVISKI